ncbi:MAG: M3 family oligoendopeptidase, partial [Clostridia bacterium]|nr:M3 family oligoendopeptidase [Clostridia bacterium]
NLAYDPDPAVRKDAYEAELACYGSIKEAVAFALNSIKLQTITECEIRGYDSPLDKALKNSRMKRETLDALIGAMEEYLPKFWQYLRAKAKALGHENGLPWYDLFAPMGKSDRTFTVEETKEALLSFFTPFDAELAGMIRRAFDENWIDFWPHEGKVGGAFDAGVPSAKQSRVLTNFAGSFSDVITLAHELGHAFHDQQVFTHSILNQDYTMPVAETASTFNEVVANNAARAMAETKEEKINLLESELTDACQIICDIFSRYLFETSVFENRSEEFMNADRLSELMLEAQKKAYGDGLDPDCLHPFMWLCKGHYYSGDLSFYNFPYAFGGLFARGLYAKYKKEGAAFVPVYKELLHATSVNDVEDTAKIAGIDLTDKAFWEAGLASLAEEIDELCALLA